MVGHRRDRSSSFSRETVFENKRPTYETRENRIAEREIAKKIASAHDVYMIKTPHYYCVDFSGVKKGKVVAFYEMKTRNYDTHQIDPIRVGVGKLAAMINLSDVTGLPAYLVYAMNDGTMTFKTTRESVRLLGIVVWGRKDRGDSNDIEPSFEIPVGLWSRIL